MKVETEFKTTYDLIKRQNLEEVVSILENRNYGVVRDYNSVISGWIDIAALKHIGRSYLMIYINLRRKRLYAHSKRLEFTAILPFRDYSKDEVLKVIRKLPTYQSWRYRCLGRDYGRCQGCGIDFEKAFSLGLKGLDIHHIKPLIKIIQDNNIETWADAEKCFPLWDLDNGITLCRFCHTKVTNFQKYAMLKLQYCCLPIDLASFSSRPQRDYYRYDQLKEQIELLEQQLLNYFDK